MRMQTDQFDTFLPKTERFFSPPKTKTQPSQADPAIWGYLLTALTTILIMTFLAGIRKARRSCSHLYPADRAVRARPYSSASAA
jgi:hypothetical protein